jgi:magnesium-transporting ATPase (P-type)
MSAYIFMTTLVLFINYFGFDMDGFKNYVYLPISAQKLLLSKNLALALFVGGEFLICLYLYIALYPLPSFSQILFICFAFSSSLCGALILGNFFSIRFPSLIDLGQPNQKRNSSAAFLALNFLSVILFLPVFSLWIAYWSGESALLIMAFIFVCMFCAYLLVFPYTTQLLEEEMDKILGKVTKQT